MTKNDLIKKENEWHYFWGRMNMYLDNTRQNFLWPPIPDEKRRIKITQADLNNSEFIEFFREHLGVYHFNDMFRTFETDGKFWMERNPEKIKEYLKDFAP